MEVGICPPDYYEKKFVFSFLTSYNLEFYFYRNLNEISLFLFSHRPLPRSKSILLLIYSFDSVWEGTHASARNVEKTVSFSYFAGKG